jgi:hypothetical protein
MIGAHRFVRTLDLLGDGRALVEFDPAHDGVSIHDAGRPDISPAASIDRQERRP